MLTLIPESKHAQLGLAFIPLVYLWLPHPILKIRILQKWNTGHIQYSCECSYDCIKALSVHCFTNVQMWSCTLVKHQCEREVAAPLAAWPDANTGWERDATALDNQRTVHVHTKAAKEAATRSRGAEWIRALQRNALLRMLQGNEGGREIQVQIPGRITCQAVALGGNRVIGVRSWKGRLGGYNSCKNPMVSRALEDEKFKSQL